jgi:aminoglycoside phosphotransferase (APT) family kinase protein
MMARSGTTQPDPGTGPLLTVGTTADIYLLDDDRVLRRYREEHDLSREAAIMRHLAEHGFPVPVVHAAQGLDLVMERVHGPTQLQALTAGELSIPEGAQQLADLHTRLHAVPSPPGADGVIVHLALHPANVILSERHGPVLVDWTNARTGPADLDVAVTGVIIGEVAADEAEGQISRGARALLAAFLVAADGDPVPHLDEAVRIRLADPSLVPDERALVRPGAELVRHFRAH